MEEVVKIQKLNHSFMRVECTPSTAMELHEYFAFEAPNARWDPRVKNKMWDGKLRLFSLVGHQLYVGLYRQLSQFCKERNYQLIKIDSEYGVPFEVTKEFTIEIAEKFAKALRPWSHGEELTLHDYQLDAFYRAIKYQRRIFLSPTSSGKSLIIYLIVRMMLAWKPDKKILIIVPTTSLVEQMYSDFVEYSTINKWNVSKHTSKIYSGFTKYPTTEITISTWQSLYTLPKEYFSKFYTVIGDEVHQYKATSLKSIMEKCTQAKIRIGTTGTLDGLQINRLVLEGLFGTIQTVATSKELMDRGILSPLKIKCVVLGYSGAECLAAKKMDYQEEISFLIAHEKRNRFIRNLCLAQTGNTLCLYTRVANHGQILYDMIKEKAHDKRKVFFVSGKTEALEREQIRNIVEKERDAIIVASYGTFSTGINLRNLHSLIFASPHKGIIRNLQSIGRGLRRSDDSGKEFCTLYDLSDDLSVIGNKRKNFSLQHLLLRLDIYNSEQFSFTISQIPLS